MGSTSDKTNELFWLEYGQALADKIGKFGESTSLFLATEAQKGPVAGDNIPDEYTNAGIFAIGDNLLSTDNPFYVPSALHSYREALDTYLNYVALVRRQAQRRPGRAIASLKQDQASAQNNYSRQLKKAQDRYKEEFDAELSTKKFFEYVAMGNTPGYLAAKQQLANVAQQIYQVQSKINGPLAATVNQDRAKLGFAAANDREMAGYNMRAAFGEPPSAREINRILDNGEKLPEPNYTLVPTYRAEKYKRTVEGVMRKSEGEYDVPVRISLTVDTSKDNRDFTFNSATGGASVGATLGGWFSFNVGGSHSEESTNLETGSETSSVKIDIRYDELVAVHIDPGMWLGYDITVGASTASSIDTSLKKTTSGNGSISIFGIPISLGGGGSKTSEKQSHEAKWDSSSRTFRVTPVADNGFATIIGVVGEKFKIL